LNRPVVATVGFQLSRLARNGYYLLFAVGMPIGFYVLYTQMYGPLTPFASTRWGAYFMVSMATFGAVGTTLNVTGTLTAFDRQSGWTRVLRLTPLPSWAYVAAQLVTAMAASLLVCVGILLTALATGLPPEPGYVAQLALVWAGSAVYSALGLFLAYALDGPTVTYAVIALYMASCFLGGLWTPLAVLPRVFTRIAAWTPSFHLADMAWQLQAGHAVPLSDVGVLAAYLLLFAVGAGALYRARA